MNAHFLTCPLCEAMCGLTVEVNNRSIEGIRGDPADPFSRGFLCPKALALKDIHEDPDRLRRPLRRTVGGWSELEWEEALNETASRLHNVRARYGPDSIALYSGNPNSHSYTAQLGEGFFMKALGTRSRFSTASMDHLPHMFAAYHLFGHKLLLAVPDVDRTDFLLILGANPVESNGSLMSAPGVPRRLQEIRQRGGRVVLIDPRRTKTAALADTHHFIRPGTDALLLLAMIYTLSSEKRLKLGRLAAITHGVARVEEVAISYSPESVAKVVGMDANTIRQLARDFVAAPSAVCYGRVGACTQEFGALTCWLMLVLNVLSGNLDRPGGAMFTRPAVDIVRLSALLGGKGSYGLWHSRVRGLPEFGGELPVAVLAEEIDTPGSGQIRALITSAGNPILSTPNGTRLERALPKLDFMVSIDFYLNETTRHAHIVLPPVFALEREHYDLVLHSLAVRNTVRYTAPLFDAGEEARNDWDIYLELTNRLSARSGGIRGQTKAFCFGLFRRLGPRTLLNWLIRMGPYGEGLNPFSKGITLRRLLRKPHSLDLGPLEPCFPERLYTNDKKINLAPEVFLSDLNRLAQRLRQETPGEDQLLLIGRRQIRSNNSWMHNSPRLMKGSDRCTLLMHPEDASQRGLVNGQRVEVRSRTGTVIAPLEVSDTVMPGVVSLPHGFGHNRSGTKLQTANCNAGVSLNDITDDQRIDALSATASFSGTPVCIFAASSEES